MFQTGKYWVVILCMTIAPQCFAQLNGNYTIDATTSAAATDRLFKNWDSFFKSLHNFSNTNNPRTDGGPIVVGMDSISSSVNLKINSSNKINETNQLILTQIKGASKTNNFTIDGNFQTLNYNGSNAVFQFNGADYITLKNITIINSNSSPCGIWIYNQADYNVITGCTILFPNLTNNSKSTYYLSLSTSETNPILAGYGLIGKYGQTGSFNTFTKNSFNSVSKNGVAPYYGITINGNSNTYSKVSQNNTFTDNEILNFGNCAIYQTYTNGNIITNNYITRPSTTITSTNQSLDILCAIYNSDAYSTSRSTQISKNKIVNIQNHNAKFQISYHKNCFGNTTFPFIFNENTFSNFQLNNSGYMNLFQDVAYLVATGNTVQHIQTNANLYSFFIANCDNKSSIINNKFDSIKQVSVSGLLSNLTIYNYYNTKNTDISCNSNSITNNFSAGNLSNITISEYAGKCKSIEIIDNNIYNNITNKQNYSLKLSIGSTSAACSFKINRNYCVGNVSQAATGLHYFMIDGINNVEMIGNVIAGNYANSQIISIRSTTNTNKNYTAEIRNNTFQTNTAASPTPDSSYTDLIFSLNNQTMIFTGNILHLVGNGQQISGRLIFEYLKSKEAHHNTYSISSQFKKFQWSANGASYKNWDDFKTSDMSGVQDNSNNPKFINEYKNDWRPGEISLQNNVPFITQNELDCKRIKRNTHYHDRGGLEVVMDVEAISTDLVLPEAVCARSNLGTFLFTVKNLFPYDSIYKLPVSYSVNNGPKNTDTIFKKIPYGDTATISFTQPLRLYTPGVNKISVFVDFQDDNPSNDTIHHYTFVNHLTSGSKFTQTNAITSAIYQPNENYDVTIVGQPVEYTINPPRVFTNKNYVGNGDGNKWSAEAYATSQSGKPVIGLSIENPTALSDLKLNFLTTDKLFEDSIITLFVKITDNNLGCDTVIKRHILVYPSIKTIFYKPSKVCLGEKILFQNNSTVKSGKMQFYWDFGTGILSDSSTNSSPEFRYIKAGVYKVILHGKTIPYGFSFSDSTVFQVLESPTAAFSHQNACEKEKLTFINQSKPAEAIAEWDFGDNLGTSGENEPHYQYAKGGSYFVTLKVRWGGCTDSMKKMVYQLPNPSVNFRAENSCAGVPVKFINETKWLHGGISYEWNFSDNSFSNDTNPTHNFNVTRTTSFNVTLKASISEGCTDSLTQQITVHEGPKTCDFVANPDYSFGFYGMKFEPLSFTGNIGPQNNVIYNWTITNSPPVTSPIFQFDFPSDGTFEVNMQAVSEFTGCECSLSKTVVMNRASSKFDNSNQFMIYPNPSNGEVKIVIPESQGNLVKVEVLDFQGKVCKQIETDLMRFNSLNITDLPDGIYVIKVQTSSGNFTNKLKKIH